MVKANEKIEKNVEKKASQKQVGAGKLPQVGADKPRSKKREANIRNIKSASPRVSSPVQVTSSPGVNHLVRAAAVKKEALKRSNMGGSPSTPQRPSQNQLSPSLQALSPDTRATISQGIITQVLEVIALSFHFACHSVHFACHAYLRRAN